MENRMLLPCPFCASRQVRLVRLNAVFNACCDDCGIRTSDCKSPDDAGEVWNSTQMRDMEWVVLE